MTEAGTFNDLDYGETLRGFRAGQTVLGRYRLEHVLGRGGMGVVWLARDEILNRPVALKFLPEMMVRDKLAVADLKREANRCMDITHLNIVRVNDFLEDEARGIVGISMEYVDGDNLSNLRADREGRCFEARELRGWVESLCLALEYAHRKAKVVHRDLKPANLMVTKEGELKVADFGIARSLVDSLSRVSAGHDLSSGTLVYMSPQQAIGRAVSALDDVYSLGATLYDLLTGRPPFYTGNIYEQLKQVVPSPVSQRRTELGAGKEPIPPEWEKTIAACLEKDPAKRPQSAGEIAYRLGLGNEFSGQALPEIPKAEVIRTGHAKNSIGEGRQKEHSASASPDSQTPFSEDPSSLGLDVLKEQYREALRAQLRGECPAEIIQRLQRELEKRGGEQRATETRRRRWMLVLVIFLLFVLPLIIMILENK